MEFTIDRTDLVTLAKRAKSIAPSKAPSAEQQILTCCVLSANISGLVVTAADKEMAYIGGHPASVTKPGKVAINAADLMSAASALPSGKVSATLNDRMKLTLTNGKSKFVLPGLDPANYPVAPTPDKDPAVFRVDSNQLARIIAQSKISAGGAAFALDGMHPEYIDGKLRLASTDGKRMTWSQCVAESTGVPSAGCILPLRAMDEVAGMVEDVDGPVTLAIGRRVAVLTLPGLSLSFLLKETEFPQYHALIPTSFSRSFAANRSQWLDAVGRASTFCVNDNIMRMSFGAEGVTMAASRADSGSATVETDGEFKGETTDTYIVSGSLKDALGAIEEETVTMKFGGDSDPFVIDSGDAQFVLMPCRAPGQ